MLVTNGMSISNIGNKFIKKKFSKTPTYKKCKDLEFTDETLEAIKEIKEGKGSKAYTDVDELMRDLLK